MEVIPKVETPETLSEVTEAIPPITDVDTPAEVENPAVFA